MCLRWLYDVVYACMCQRERALVVVTSSSSTESACATAQGLTQHCINYALYVKKAREMFVKNLKFILTL